MSIVLCGGEKGLNICEYRVIDLEHVSCGLEVRDRGVTCQWSWPGIIQHRRLIEYEVACIERRRIHTMQRNRLSIAQRDHSVTGAVLS
jgi:hypothetical protein